MQVRCVQAGKVHAAALELRGHSQRASDVRRRSNHHKTRSVGFQSDALTQGKEVASILWLSELGHSKDIIQSDGEPASEVVMRMVQSKGAMMENPPGEEEHNGHHASRQLFAYMVDTTRSIAVHVNPLPTRLINAAFEKIRHISCQNPILLVGEAVACRSAWFEAVR